MRTSWKHSLGRLGAILAGLGMVTAAVAGNVTTERLIQSEKEPENWLNHHGNLEAQRFSGLAQINKSNVKQLKVAFTFAMEPPAGSGKGRTRSSRSNRTDTC